MAYAAPVPTQRARPSTGAIQQQMKPPAFMTHQRTRTFNAGSAQQAAPSYNVQGGPKKAVEHSLPRRNSNEMYDEIDDEEFKGIEEIVNNPSSSSSPQPKIHERSQAYDHHSSPVAHSAMKKVVAAIAGPPKTVTKRARDSEDENESGKKKSKKNTPPSTTKTRLVTNIVSRKTSITNMAAPIRSPKTIKNAHLELPKTKNNIARAATQVMRFPSDLIGDVHTNMDLPTEQNVDRAPTHVMRIPSQGIPHIPADEEHPASDASEPASEKWAREINRICPVPGLEDLRQYYADIDKQKLEAATVEQAIDDYIEIHARDSEAGDQFDAELEHDPDQTAVQREDEQEQEDEGVYVGQQVPTQKVRKEVQQEVASKEVAHLVLRPDCKCNNCFYDPHQATKYDNQTHAEWKAEGQGYITKLSETTQEYMKLMVTRVDAFDVLVKKMDIHMEELDVAKKDAEEKKEAVRSGLPWN